MDYMPTTECQNINYVKIMLYSNKLQFNQTDLKQHQNLERTTS